MPEPGEQGRWSSAAGRSASGRGSSSTTAPCTRRGRCEAAGYESIMINSNPETVSTDFDTCDRLYFEPLDEESVRDILENEAGDGAEAAATAAGDRAVRRADGDQPRRAAAHAAACRSSASSFETIDLAEDRRRVRGIPERPRHPAAAGRGGPRASRTRSTSRSELGYPVLVRPSYVLGGRAMEIVHEPVRAGALSAAGRRHQRRQAPILDRQVPHGQRGRGRRDLRRRGACSSPASWSTSSAPACTPATRWPSTPVFTSPKTRSTRSSTTRRASASRSTRAASSTCST